MILNNELMITQITKKKIRHEERRQRMLGGESLGKNVGNHLGALKALTHRLFKNSVEELETTKHCSSPPLKCPFLVTHVTSFKA